MSGLLRLLVLIVLVRGRVDVVRGDFMSSDFVSEITLKFLPKDAVFVSSVCAGSGLSPDQLLILGAALVGRVVLGLGDSKDG